MPVFDEEIKRINALAQRFKQIPNQAIEITKEIVREDIRAGIFSDLNRFQLFISKTATNQDLGVYSPRTIARKRQRGTFVKNEIILREEENLYDNIVSELNDTSLIIKNVDPDRQKVQALIRRFSIDIFGISQDDQDVYIETRLRPRLFDRLFNWLVNA